MTKMERYLLTRSEEFRLEPNEEVRVDLKLNKRPCPTKNKITGKVTSCGRPVPHATVKVLDHKYNPVTHALTDQAGVYLIENLKSGDYKLTATAPGFLVADIVSFSIVPKEVIRINFSLKEDKSARENNFVYGTVRELMTMQAIKDCEISLFSPGSPRPYAEALSNESGQYLFCSIPPGEYFALAGKPGYFPSDPIKFLVAKGQLLKIDFLLQKNTLVSTATVSGIITDHFGSILVDVCVGLFRADNHEETLLAAKMTNGEGFYLFTDVPPGKYVVKAKIQDQWQFAQAVDVP